MQPCYALYLVVSNVIFNSFGKPRQGSHFRYEKGVRVAINGLVFVMRG